VGSGCFHVQGIPTLHLSCPHGSVIRVDQVFFGAPPNNATCEFAADDNHCIQLADLHEHCNGRPMCSGYVSNPFLMNCRAYANYMQINYTCVAGNSAIQYCKPMYVIICFHASSAVHAEYLPRPRVEQ
jgi:hypothetical protein